MSSLARKPSANLDNESVNLRRRKQEIRKNVPDVSTMFSSNKSAVSIEEFGCLPQTKGDIETICLEDSQANKNRSNWSFLNETIRKIEPKPVTSMKVIPSEARS